jgi:hypothetical protein
MHQAALTPSHVTQAPIQPKFAGRVSPQHKRPAQLAFYVVLSIMLSRNIANRIRGAHFGEAHLEAGFSSPHMLLICREAVRIICSPSSWRPSALVGPEARYEGRPVLLLLSSRYLIYGWAVWPRVEIGSTIVQPLIVTCRNNNLVRVTCTQNTIL